MSYYEDDDEDDGLYYYAWILSSLGCLSLVLYGAISGVVYLKNRWSERNYKKVLHVIDKTSKEIAEQIQFDKVRLARKMEHVDDKMQKCKYDRLKYTERLLFRNRRMEDHPVFRKNPKEEELGYYENCMFKFEELLYEKEFLITFVNIMEEVETESPRDAFEMASFLVLALLDSMEYTMYALKRIIGRRIKKVIETETPANLFPNPYGVVERLVTVLIGICIYDHMETTVRPALFRLYYAVKFYCEMGMVDSVTFEAEHTLMHNRIANFHKDAKTLVLTVSLGCEPPFEVEVINFDSINQIKSKILYDAYKNLPASELPSIDQFDLEWKKEDGSLVLFLDEDDSCEYMNGWKRFNTLHHYGVDTNIHVLLSTRAVKVRNPDPKTGPSTSSLSTHKIDSEMSFAEILESSKELKVNDRLVTISKEYNCLLNRLFHLGKGDDDFFYQVQQRKKFPEKYFPEKSIKNIFKTKMVLKEYIDEMLVAISDISTVPSVVKWLFEFFDQQILKHNLEDPNILETWRGQTIGRFWEYLITNPNIMFDVEVRNDIKNNLEIIGNNFTQAILPEDEVSPYKWTTIKLLHHSDIENYRVVFSEYYSNVKSISNDLSSNFFDKLSTISDLYKDKIDSLGVLKELYYFVTKNRLKLLNALSDDPDKKALKYKLLSVSLPSWCESFDTGLTDEDILKKLQLLCNKQPKKKKKKKKKYGPSELFGGGDDQDVNDDDSDLDDIFDDDILLHKEDKKDKKTTVGDQEDFINKARKFADKATSKSKSDSVKKQAEAFAESAKHKRW